MRRVVVTGMGMVTPLGRGLSVNQKGIMAGRSVISKVESFDMTDYPSRIAGLVPRGTLEGQFSPDDVLEIKEQRHMDDFVILGFVAAHDALKDSGFVPESDLEKERAGVCIGSGIGGIRTIESNVKLIEQFGPRRVSPFFIPMALNNLISGQVSIRYGLQGPNLCVVTACATGSHAIGDAARLIETGEADVMLAGGSESAVCPLAMAGFSQMRALSTQFNDEPQRASRPWDKKRDGFVMGEGAGVLVLEEYEHAKKRGAHIYAELVGYGYSGDAHHITAPGNNGAVRAIRNALKKAQMNPQDIDYINAHGTSTPVGDLVELDAVRQVFADSLDKISMSSTKSTIGHLLGASGAVEAIYSIMALNESLLPPTVNLDDPCDEANGLDLVPHKAKEKKLSAVMSNSFGFGGTNATVIFKKVSS